jgi:hypothetical protein
MEVSKLTLKKGADTALPCTPLGPNTPSIEIAELLDPEIFTLRKTNSAAEFLNRKLTGKPMKERLVLNKGGFQV